MKSFQHRNFLAWGRFFGIEKFRHHTKQYWCLSTDILAPMLLCRNLHVPKCPCAETSMVRKNPFAEKSPCWKVLVYTKTSTEMKCPCAEKPTGPKRAHAEPNVLVMKCLCRNVSGRNVRCQNGRKPIRVLESQVWTPVPKTFKSVILLAAYFDLKYLGFVGLLSLHSLSLQTKSLLETGTC